MGEGNQTLRRNYRRWAWILVFLVTLAGVLIFWKLTADPEIPCITFPFGAQSLSFDSSGKLLMILHDGVIDVRNVKTGNQVATIDARPQAIASLTLDKERAFGCFGTYGGEIGIFDAHSFVITSRFSIGSVRIESLALSWKKQLVLTFGYEGHMGNPTVRIFELPSGTILRKIKWGYLRSMTISADEELVALNESSDVRPDHELRVARLDSLKDLNEWTLKFPEVDGLAFLGQSHVLVVAQPSQLSLWDFDAKKQIDRVGYPGRTPMTASDDGTVLAVAGYMTLYIIQTNPLRVVRIVGACRSMGIEAVAISPDAKYLAASC
jgi:hypothetical protein